MALKKYRFFVGACGPTVMYSNIIRAEDEISAVKIYLSKAGKALTDENIAMQLRNIREVVPKENPEMLLDYSGKEISSGDEVMFTSGNMLLSGKVEKITAKSIVVKTQDGECVRIVLPKDEDDTLTRVLVMAPRPARMIDGPVDASGYPLYVGDPVAYMGDMYAGTCKGLKNGNITKITAKTVVVGTTRKSLDKVVVINW